MEGKINAGDSENKSHILTIWEVVIQNNGRQNKDTKGREKIRKIYFLYSRPHQKNLIFEKHYHRKKCKTLKKYCKNVI